MREVQSQMGQTWPQGNGSPNRRAVCPSTPFPFSQPFIMPVFLHLGLVSVDSVGTLAERSATATQAFCGVLEKVALL